MEGAAPLLHLVGLILSALIGFGLRRALTARLKPFEERRRIRIDLTIAFFVGAAAGWAIAAFPAPRLLEPTLFSVGFMIAERGTPLRETAIRTGVYAAGMLLFGLLAIAA